VNVAAATRLAAWRASPPLFAREVCGVTPDAWQDDALAAIVGDGGPVQRVAMQACAGPGKTLVLAVAGWWHLVTQGEQGHHPLAAAVSITGDNLRDGLQREMRAMQMRSPLLTEGFEFGATTLRSREHPATWYLSWRTFPRDATPDAIGKTLSGLHARYLLYLIDEAGAMPPQVGLAAEQGAATAERDGGHCRILMAGNPILTSGLLYDATVRRAQQHRVIRITADPDDPLRSPRVSAKWAAEMIATMPRGRSNPWVQAYILGQWPDSPMSSLVSTAEVQAAMRRAPTPAEYDFEAQVIGVDVAGGGADKTVIFRRQGVRAWPPDVLQGASPSAVAARVATLWREWGADACAVDDSGGYGSGVVDALRLAGYDPVAVQFGGMAEDHKRFPDKRCEMLMRLRDWVVSSGALPADCGELLEELPAHTLCLDSGRTVIAPKRLVRRALQGRSPDYTDALALTFARTWAPRTFRSGDPLHALLLDRMADRSQREKYDPFAWARDV